MCLTRFSLYKNCDELRPKGLCFFFQMVTRSYAQQEPSNIVETQGREWEWAQQWGNGGHMIILWNTAAEGKRRRMPFSCSDSKFLSNRGKSFKLVSLTSQKVINKWNDFFWCDFNSSAGEIFKFIPHEQEMNSRLFHCRGLYLFSVI